MQHKSFIIQCIERARGDDMHRAERAFRNFTTTQMQEEHGQSGNTRQEVLDSYRHHSLTCDNAIIEVQAL